MKSLTIIDGSNEFVFNSNTDGTTLKSFTGFEYPSTRPVIEDIPARDGSIYITSRFGRRRLSWSGVVTDDNVFTKRRSALASMNQGGLKTLKFTTYDDIELQAQIEVLNIVMPYTHRVSEFLVEVVAPDYRFYSQALVSSSTGVTSTGGGMPVPAAIPAPIGGTTTAPLSVTNSGTTTTYPIITITGPGTNFSVSNIDTGETFQLNLTLTSGESVVIDTLARTAYKGNQNVFGSFVGDWLSLQTGVNRITFNAQTGSTGSTQVSIQHRHAYLGL